MVMLETNQCRRCKGALINTDTEIVCSKCGFVQEERFEDNTYDYDERVGAPRTNLYHDTSSVISNKVTDASGKRISNQTNIKRMRIWDNRIRSAPNRNTQRAMTEISRLGDVLKVPDNIKQRAAEIYVECEKRRLLRGRTIDVFAVACLYASCRESNIPKTLQSFVTETYARRTDITSYYRLILKSIDIKPAIQTPVLYIGKIASNVNPPISQPVQRFAQKIIDTYDGIAGKDPIGLAAAALYIACVIKGIHITQKKIAVASDVTEVTIRNRFKDLHRSYKENVEKNPTKDDINYIKVLDDKESALEE